MSDDHEWKRMVMEQLLAIREDLGMIKGKSATWGAIAGAGVSIIGFMVEILWNKG